MDKLINRHLKKAKTEESIHAIKMILDAGDRGDAAAAAMATWVGNLITQDDKSKSLEDYDNLVALIKKVQNKAPKVEVDKEDEADKEEIIEIETYPEQESESFKPDSEWIESVQIDYDSIDDIWSMTVKINGGSEMVYEDFPKETYEDWRDHCVNGGSAGKWYHANLKKD